jgi:hypothetical protein
MRYKLFISIVVLLFSVPALGASLITHTVCPSGCDYSVLNTAITHIETTHANFDTGDNYHEVVISGDWTGSPDTTAVSIDGLTQSTSARYLHIYTTGDARHNGVYGGNAKAYRLEVSEATGVNCQTNPYIRIEGLQIQLTGTTAVASKFGLSGGSVSGAADIRFSNNIIKGVVSGSGTWYGGIYVYTSNASALVSIFNNIIYNFRNGVSDKMWGVYSNGATAHGTVNIINNTIENTYTGVERDWGTVNIYNTGFSTVTTKTTGTINTDTTNSVTTPTFVNESGDDFHLQVGDSTWQGQGTDTPTGYLSNLDIDWEARTSTWDIGADEYVSRRRMMTVN